MAVILIGTLTTKPLIFIKMWVSRRVGMHQQCRVAQQVCYNGAQLKINQVIVVKKLISYQSITQFKQYLIEFPDSLWLPITKTRFIKDQLGVSIDCNHLRVSTRQWKCGIQGFG
jgi:hypothetical protein